MEERPLSNSPEPAGLGMWEKKAKPVGNHERKEEGEGLLGEGSFRMSDSDQVNGQSGR